MMQSKLFIPREKSLWQRVYHFFLQFNMCRCAEPKYEVLNGILCCNVCEKPVKWEARQKENTK